MAEAEAEKKREIKTNSDLIFEIYDKKLAEFKRKLKVLSKRNRSLARYVYLHAYCICALEHPEMPQAEDPLTEYQPKRGKKQELTFPIKLVQEALKCSHRQASVYHLAGRLEEEANELASIQGRAVLLWKAEQKEPK